jgi:hypothetical protein
MKEITFTELKKMTLEEVRDGPCLKIAGVGWDGPPLYVIPKVEGPMNSRIQGICSQIDAGRGITYVKPTTPVEYIIMKNEEPATEVVGVE